MIFNVMYLLPASCVQAANKLVGQARALCEPGLEGYYTFDRQNGASEIRNDGSRCGEE